VVAETGGIGANVAVQARSVVIHMEVDGDVPSHAPDQPTKSDPPSGTAVRATSK
jgi:hypothetical protein